MPVEKCFRANENKKKKEAMAIECLKLKVSLSIPWSLLQMVVWEKNAFGFTKDQQR